MPRRNRKPNRSQKRQQQRQAREYDDATTPRRSYDVTWPEASNFNNSVKRHHNKGFGEGERAVKQTAPAAKKKYISHSARPSEIWKIAEDIFGTTYYWFRKDGEYVTADSERRESDNSGASTP